jgi:hypothetical protein
MRTLCADGFIGKVHSIRDETAFWILKLGGKGKFSEFCFVAY